MKEKNWSPMLTVVHRNLRADLGRTEDGGPFGICTYEVTSYRLTYSPVSFSVHSQGTHRPYYDSFFSSSDTLSNRRAFASNDTAISERPNSTCGGYRSSSPKGSNVPEKGILIIIEMRGNEDAPEASSAPRATDIGLMQIMREDKSPCTNTHHHFFPVRLWLLFWHVQVYIKETRLRTPFMCHGRANVARGVGRHDVHALLINASPVAYPCAHNDNDGQHD
ncbi:hypothetical protein B0H16DRAFT_1500990 [Mycena metata]|uniref:Uncharacterized protein n=1 Tax=Mycena metata TaxID=1033252 RepID=A0AAD7K8J2_9AGAR|nr:hypothetical protein B0H16DRAFT_1500990 [Mycena metata]